MKRTRRGVEFHRRAGDIKRSQDADSSGTTRFYSTFASVRVH